MKKDYMKPEINEFIIASQCSFLTGSAEESSVTFDDGYSTIPDDNNIDL